MDFKFPNPRRYYQYCRTTRPFVIKHIVLCSISLTVMSVLFILHFYILPTVSGAYNNECYLSQERLDNLRYAVQSIGITMAYYNVTYWLDYGTLLGAVQKGDVLPWDGDADISFLLTEEQYSVHQDLYKLYGIHSNGLQANYKGLYIDYIRWEERQGSYNGKTQVILQKFYPQSVLKNENTLAAWHHKLESFPKSWVKPRKWIDFKGVKLAIPNVPDELLSHRYSLTYKLGLSVPYKWKCYVPCWVRHSYGC